MTLGSREKQWTADDVTIWVDGLGRLHFQAPCGEVRVFTAEESELLAEKIKTAIRHARKRAFLPPSKRPAQTWWGVMLEGLDGQ